MDQRWLAKVKNTQRNWSKEMGESQVKNGLKEKEQSKNAKKWIKGKAGEKS